MKRKMKYESKYFQGKWYSKVALFPDASYWQLGWLEDPRQ